MQVNDRVTNTNNVANACRICIEFSLTFLDFRWLNEVARSIRLSALEGKVDFSTFRQVVSLSFLCHRSFAD